MILTCPQCATRYRVNGAAFAPPGRQVRCKKCQHSWFQSPPAEEELALVDDVAEAPPVVKRPLPPPPPPPAPPVTANPVRAESAIATAMRKAEAYVEPPVAQPVPEPVKPVFRPLPTAPPVEEEEEPVAPAPVFKPQPPPQPQPPPVQNRAPPPFRPQPQPQVFQPAAQPSRFRGGVLQLGAILIWVGVFLFIGLVIGSAVYYRYDIIRTWRPAATIYSLFGLDVNVRGLVFTISSDQVPMVQNDIVIKGEIVNTTQEEQPIPKVRASLLDKQDKPVFEWTFAVNAERVGAGGKVPFLTKVGNPPPTADHVELRFAPLDE